MEAVVGKFCIGKILIKGIFQRLSVGPQLQDLSVFIIDHDGGHVFPDLHQALEETVIILILALQGVTMYP